MDFGIRGRTALVTGASAGIGAAVALGLAREGVRLAVAARDAARLDAVVREAKQAGAAEAAAFPLDLGDPNSIAIALERLARGFGNVDIVVLNGGGPRPGRFTEMSLTDWDGAYQLLVRGMLGLLENLVPAMRARKWGRIVALTSSSVKQPIDTLVLSNAFRTALVSALRTLAVEVAPDGVTVNCIATGRVDTDRLRKLYGDDEKRLQQAAREIPIGHIATPQEFAPAAVFLCSEPARYVTGQTISVDGGLVRGLFG
ncbi:MAG TPA: SDR family oxidoreductase [Candidatus Cybelea sp.]|jgi:3-oxoacyl-[acyl-carrier protein] reductase